MNLNRFMQQGIADILKTVGRFYLKNADGRRFLSRMVPRMRKSAAVRSAHEAAGNHIPSFLIASIASGCNLQCARCYARAGGACAEEAARGDMSQGQWRDIFAQAQSLGVAFILLAGGEPFTRRDVIEAAAQCDGIVFPIFTNGTMMTASDTDFFDTHRHLIPIFSVEGNEKETDARRGAGVFADVRASMQALSSRSILYGVSITVTRENMDTVLDEGFVQALRQVGAGAAIYVEYVPAEKGTEHLALHSAEQAQLQARTQVLKGRFGDMVVLSFPGDEAAMGGCLASGRGFFHINPQGGAEPCPFSPFAKLNLQTTPMLDVLNDRYFRALRTLASEAGPHTGGCVLFEREADVRALLAQG